MTRDQGRKRRLRTPEIALDEPLEKLSIRQATGRAGAENGLKLERCTRSLDDCHVPVLLENTIPFYSI